jgi:hypothetical protein
MARSESKYGDIGHKPSGSEVGTTLPSYMVSCLKLGQDWDFCDFPLPLQEIAGVVC